MNSSLAERNKFASLCEKYNRETGLSSYDLVDGTKVVGVSANTWGDYWKLINGLQNLDHVVVSPELITLCDISADNLSVCRDAVLERLDNLIQFSLSKPDTLYVIGTPLYIGTEKPMNSALLIKNGEVVGSTNKRSGSTNDEAESFQLMPEESPYLIPGTNTHLLICADLPISMLYATSIFKDDPEGFSRILELANKQYLAGNHVQPIPESAVSILVMSCWAVGGSFIKEGNYDEYYRLQLRNICWRLMMETKVKEIFVVDRCPSSQIYGGIGSKRPYNGVFKMI